MYLVLFGCFSCIFVLASCEEDVDFPQRRKRSLEDFFESIESAYNNMQGQDNSFLNPKNPNQDSALYNLSPLVMDMVLDLSVKVEPEFPDCGEVASVGNGYVFPWHVSIYVNEGFRYQKYKRVCGGTLISKTHVITHYECFLDIKGKPLDVSRFRLAFGKKLTDINSYEEHQQIRSIKSLHTGLPEANGAPKTKDAIVFVTLENKVNLNEYVRPACLSLNKTKEMKNMKFKYVGTVPFYDQTYAISSDNEQLQSIISYKNCSKVFRRDSSWMELSSDIFCGIAVMQDHPNSLCTIDKGSGYVFLEPNKQGIMRYFLRGVFTSTVGEKQCSIQLKFIRLTSDTNKALLLYANTWFTDE